MSSSAEILSRLSVGSRVRDGEGFRGTVRYIGPVAAAKNKSDTWLGVEWDNHSRGKHDGSCVDDRGTLHQHFKCLNGAGSFVKPHKIDAGRSFLDALKERYVELNAPVIANVEDSTLPDAFVITSKGHQKGIEFVGEQKIRKWQQLDKVEKVAVRNDTIATVGDVGEVTAVAAHLVEVDLQDNLLSRWKEIVALGQAIPKLSTLLLHGNRMEMLTNDLQLDLDRSAFSNLRVLALNACGITSWAQVQSVLEPILPVLEELYLSSNALTDLRSREAEKDYEAATGIVYQPDVQAVRDFPHLRVLDVSFCGLTEWSQVLEFGTLPLLQELVLDGNPLAMIERPIPLSLPTVPTAAASLSISTSTSDFNSKFGAPPPTSVSLLGSCSHSSVAAVGAAAASATNMQPKSSDTAVFPPAVPSEDEYILFPALYRLSISSTRIASWRDLNTLSSHYPGVRMLRLTHIPLFSGKGASEVRPYVIARMKHLSFFNGSVISARERKDSEKLYLRQVLREIDDLKKKNAVASVADVKKCKECGVRETATNAAATIAVAATGEVVNNSPAQQVLSLNEESTAATAATAAAQVDEQLQQEEEEHPRFAELHALYASELLPMGEAVTSGRGTIASDLVSVTFKNLSFSSNGSLEPLQKRLPKSLTVGKVKLMVKQLFHLEPRLQILSMRIDKGSFPVVFEDELATLQYYGAVDGSEIFVNEDA